MGSRDFNDPAIQGQVDGVTSARQPGSTLKPFVYALAFERGSTPASIVPDLPSRYKMGRGLWYTPRNYDKQHHGPVRLRAALASSLNVSAMRVASWVGQKNLLKRLQDLGFETLKRRPESPGSPRRPTTPGTS